jgi:formate hydrogenlyase subunit 3/multisubunit Na+/H+ antiporter MnhD subunit
MVNPIVLIAFPLAAAFFIILAGSLNVARVLALLVSGALAVLSPFWLSAAMGGPFPVIVSDVVAPLGIALGIDSLSAALILLISVSGFLIILYSIPYIPKMGSPTGNEAPGSKRNQTRYFAILLLMLASAFGLVMTRDIFNLFVFFEILCISSYILVAYGQEESSLEASFKYMVLGSIGSGFILVAIGLCYQYVGSLAMTDIAAGLAKAPAGYGALVTVLFVIGFGIEAAIFPLNTWLPDAHSSAPSSISAVLSGFVVEVALVVLMRLVGGVFPTQLHSTLMVLAIAGVIMGELAALGQSELKRTLAYSSIGQVSIMLFAFSLGTLDGNQAGLSQLLMHVGAKSALFLVAGYFILRTGSHKIANYAGLWRKMPVSVVFFAIATLSLIGVPPFFGFFTKLRVVSAAAAVGSPLAWTGAAAILFGSIIESVYFFRIVRVLFSEKGSETARDFETGLDVILPAATELSSSAEKPRGWEGDGGGEIPVAAMVPVIGFLLIVIAGAFLLPALDGIVAPAASILATL